MLKLFYQAMFNHFLKKEGAGSNPHFTAYLITSLFIFLSIGNLVFLAKMIYPFKISRSTIEARFIIVPVYIGLCYVLFFHILKYNKSVYNGITGYPISKKIENWAWYIFIINFLTLMSLALYDAKAKYP